jgi:glycerol transport system ATP-binding protein
MGLGAPWAASLNFDGQVTLVEITGSESFVHVQTALGAIVCVEPGVSDRQTGQPVRVQVDATRLFVFDRTGALVRAGQDG